VGSAVGCRIDPSGEQLGVGSGVALELNGEALELRGPHEKLCRQMRQRAHRRRSERHAVRFRLCIGDEFLDGLPRRLGVDDQEERNEHRERDGAKILARVIIELAQHGLGSRIRCRRIEQRVAVRLGMSHHLVGDG